MLSYAGYFLCIGTLNDLLVERYYEAELETLMRTLGPPPALSCTHFACEAAAKLYIDD